MLVDNSVDSRQARNIAAALYAHSGKPNEEVDLRAIMETAQGCAKGINDFLTWLEANTSATEEEIQFEAYECGKRHLPVNQLRIFFSSVYLMLLAKPDGPRLGLTVRLTGVEPFVQQIRKRLADPFGWLNM
jgi:lysyl-tRNA synthetase class I